MRISARPEDESYTPDANSWVVFCDGELLNNCVAADDVLNYAVLQIKVGHDWVRWLVRGDIELRRMAEDFSLARN